MERITGEWIKEKSEEIYAEFADGFEWTDLFKVLPKVIEVAMTVEGLSDEEKKGAAVAIVEYIIDETDTPWVPDSIVDPILKKAAPYLIDLSLDALKKKED
mgnify:CR=1 FL=1